MNMFASAIAILILLASIGTNATAVAESWTVRFQGLIKTNDIR